MKAKILFEDENIAILTRMALNCTMKMSSCGTAVKKKRYI